MNNNYKWGVVTNVIIKRKTTIKMADNFYMKNRHKLLLMAAELHKTGYGNMRVVPSLAPSGMYWRCSFVDKTTRMEYYYCSMDI